MGLEQGAGPRDASAGQEVGRGRRQSPRTGQGQRSVSGPGGGGRSLKDNSSGVTRKRDISCACVQPASTLPLFLLPGYSPRVLLLLPSVQACEENPRHAAGVGRESRECWLERDCSPETHVVGPGGFKRCSGLRGPLASPEGWGSRGSATLVSKALTFCPVTCPPALLLAAKSRGSRRPSLVPRQVNFSF